MAFDPRENVTVQEMVDEKSMGSDEPRISVRRRISVLGRDFHMPESRGWRIAIGVGLVILGCFGFLPILGFWMIPLGILILSYEFASVRRFRRRTNVWWGRRRGRSERSNVTDVEGK